MNVAEESIRNSTGRFNTPVEFWRCINYLKYHADIFHTYISFPNKRDLDVAEQVKQSIQDCDQRNSVMGGNIGYQDRQGQRG